MHKLLIALALVGINGLYGNLSGEKTLGIFDASSISFTNIQIETEDSEDLYAEEIQDEKLDEELVDEILVMETEPEPESVTIEEIELENKAIIPTVSEEIILDDQNEQKVVQEEELTYDQLTQRDGGDSEPETVPPEVSESWYVEETAAQGLQLILETYSIQDFSFIIDTCPSNYVYQYEFYAESPEKDHVNLVGIYQYDATGNRTFQLNQISGRWE